MTLDSSLIAQAIKNPDTLVELQAAGVTSDDLIDNYRKAWTFIIRMKREHDSIPSREMIENRFDIDLPKVRRKDLPIQLADLKARRKHREFVQLLSDATNLAGDFHDIDEALSFVQGRLNTLAITNGKNNIRDLFTKDITDQMVNELKLRRSGKIMGYPTGIPKLDYAMGGMQKNRMIVTIGRPGSGKAQPLGAKVMTPNGWKRIGKLVPGDKVITPSGEVSKVIAIHPQGEKKIYRVTFSDGSSTRTTGNHLWTVQTRNERRYKKNRWDVKTTREISHSLRAGDGEHWNYYLPPLQPFDWPEVDLPMDPYALGLLLGDGHFGYGVLTFTNPEPELAEALDQHLVGATLNEHRSDRSCPTYGVIAEERGINAAWYALEELGLIGKLSHEKWIPKIYRYTTAKNRHAILQGLIDTDGSPSGSSIEYSTSSPKLANHVEWLVRSLGGTVHYEDRQTHFTYKGKKKAGRPSVRLYLNLPKGLDPFRYSTQKIQRLGKRQCLEGAARTFRSVELIGREQAVCITIDHPEQLYITDDWTPTHNSFMNLLFVREAVLAGATVLLFPLEMTLTETAFRLYTLFSARIKGKSDKTIRNLDLIQGKASPKKLRKFLTLLEDHYTGQLLVADIGMMSDAYTVERIEAETELHRPDMFWVDYLSLMKVSGNKENKDYLQIAQLSGGIKQIAVRQNVVGGCSAQVNRDALIIKRPLPRLEHIARGDSIGQDADQVISLYNTGKFLLYSLCKNRHGPEISKGKISWFPNEGVFEELEHQEEDD